jgi:hypothetical protein
MERLVKLFKRKIGLSDNDAAVVPPKKKKNELTTVEEESESVATAATEEISAAAAAEESSDEDSDAYAEESCGSDSENDSVTKRYNYFESQDICTPTACCKDVRAAVNKCHFQCVQTICDNLPTKWPKSESTHFDFENAMVYQLRYLENLPSYYIEERFGHLNLDFP